jgi:hypothetical protein
VDSPECSNDLNQLQFAVCLSGHYQLHFSAPPEATEPLRASPDGPIIVRARRRAAGGGSGPRGGAAGGFQSCVANKHPLCPGLGRPRPSRGLARAPLPPPRACDPGTAVGKKSESGFYYLRKMYNTGINGKNPVDYKEKVCWYCRDSCWYCRNCM